MGAKQHGVEQPISLRWSWKWGMWWTSRPVASTNTNVITLHFGPDSLCQRLEVVILDRVCRVKIVMDRVMTDGQLLIEDNCCTKGHDLKTLTIHRFFNCITSIWQRTTLQLPIHLLIGLQRKKVSKLAGQLNCQWPSNTDYCWVLRTQNWIGRLHFFLEYCFFAIFKNNLLLICISTLICIYILSVTYWQIVYKWRITPSC